MSFAGWIILIGIAFFLLTCVALMDIGARDFGGIEKKAAWGFLTMVPFFGPIIYFSTGMRRGKKKPRTPGGG